MLLSEMERVEEEIVENNNNNNNNIQVSNVVPYKLEDGQVLVQESGLVRNDVTSRNDFPGSSAYRNPVSGLGSNNIDGFKAGKFEHLSRLAKGFGFGGENDDLRSRPCDMDQMLSRIRQQLARSPSERQNVVSGRLRVGGGGDKSNVDASVVASGDVQLKTPLSSSSFSQLILGRALKGKKPETRSEFSLVRTKEERLDQKLSTTTQNVSTLREYLRLGNNGKREKLLVFKHLVELVESAHSQGFFLQELRPSFFSVSPFRKLRYIGSSVKNDLDSNKKRTLSQESSIVDRDFKQRKLTRPMIDLNATDEQDQDCFNHFTSREECVSSELWLEEQWYMCPEELCVDDNRFKSNIYSLGVLLFELLCDCESNEMYDAMMADLGRRVLPPTFLSQNTKEAGFLLWLLHPEPSSRPTAREILQSELLREDESVTSANDEEEEMPELLLHFLTPLEKQKQKHASKLLQDIKTLEEDIKEAERRYSSNTSLIVNGSCDTTSNTLVVPTANTDRLISNIRQIEDAYFFMRSQLNVPGSDKSLLKDRNMCSVIDNVKKKKSSDEVEVFFEGLCKFSRYSKFETCGTIRSGDLLNSTGVICSLSFDPDEEHIAAAGISKKIKIFDYEAFTNDTVGVHYPLVEMCNKTKLSSVSWNSYIKNYLASTDYDGVVQIWDAGTGQGFSQYAEHKKRAWSVDFSPSDPTKFVSGSDDCSVKLWSINDKRSTGTIWSPANVCCVQFSDSSSHLLAFGSADYKVYCYDLRYAKTPWCTLAGHEKAVSYVKFMDTDTIVSASTDNSLKLWNLNKTYSSGLSSGACSSTYKGHTNQKNFVGLSVLNGYIACGSETNEVYNYYKSLPMPMTSHKFGSVDPISGTESFDDNGHFVSSICWRKKSNMLVAANSTGTMKLLKLV